MLLLLLVGALNATAPGRAQLTSLGATVLTQCAAPADCLADELFGKAVAVGDFDDDGFDDLAVGNSETVSGDQFAGSIHIFYGSPAPSGCLATSRTPAGRSSSCAAQRPVW